MGVQFRMLGPLEVVDDGVAVQPTSAKQLLLLGVLLVHANELVTVDVLVEALWPSRPPATATNLVQTYVSRLRKVLEPGLERPEQSRVLATVAPGYRLTVVDDDLDARRFERLVRDGSEALVEDRPEVASELLRTALALWRGPALADVADAEAVRLEARRLDELRITATEARIDADLGLGRHAQLVAELDGLVDEHPLRERFWAQLMLCQYRAGRQADALRAYQRVRVLLAEELGIEPGDALRDLDRSILVHSPGLDWTPRRDAQPAGMRFPADNTAAPDVGNLPRQRVQLIGREHELQQLAAQVRPGALVTLTGPGGVGKSCLALTSCSTLEAGFADGAWLVELIPATTVGDVLPIVVRDLGLVIESSPVTNESIARALRTQSRLVVVDNCEHVIEPVRTLVDAILARCPNVAIVATSRETLGCDGEQVLRVPTLSREAADGPSDAELLFRHRVASGWGERVAADVDAATITEICELVDGLPLALELAASRAVPLGVDEVRRRIAAGRDPLRRPRGTARHRSLTSVVAWSYDLLSPAEQRVFERLAAFSGGFDLEAAEAGCGWDGVAGPVEEHVLSLIDKSLVAVEPSSPVRYRMLESIRRYGEGRLAARGETLAMADRLLAYYRDWLERADAGTRGENEGEWHLRFQAEWSNVRSAVTYAIANDDLDSACHIVWHARWWANQRLQFEVGDWADELLAMPGAATHPLIPIVGSVAAETASWRYLWSTGMSRHAEARRRERVLGEAPEPWVPQTNMFLESFVIEGDTLPSAVEVRRRCGASPFWHVMATWNEALLASNTLAITPADVWRNPELVERVQRCVATADELGNPTCMARASDLFGCSLRLADPDRAVATLERGMTIAASVGNTTAESLNTMDLIMVHVNNDRPREAARIARPAIRTFLRAGALQYAWSLVGCVAAGFVALGHHRVAGRALGRLRPGSSQRNDEFVFAARFVAELEAAVGSAELARLMEEGSRCSMRELVTDALRALDEVGDSDDASA